MEFLKQNSGKSGIEILTEVSEFIEQKLNIKVGHLTLSQFTNVVNTLEESLKEKLEVKHS